MSEKHSLSDEDIVTSSVEGKQAWEAPRLAEMGVGVSAGGAVSFVEDDFGAFADDAAGTAGPS